MAGLLGGGSGGLRGHGELPLNADINVTSLVDVAFVLLIIFMITAPIMQGGVDVRLPRAAARPLEPQTGLIVTVDRTGRIFLDQTALSYEDFRAHGAHGVADATVTITPAAATVVYFNEQVIPDRTRTASSRDGGVVWTNVPPGRYVLRATHASKQFAEVTVTCAAGRFVNANPPHGIAEL